MGLNIAYTRMPEGSEENPDGVPVIAERLSNLPQSTINRIWKVLERDTNADDGARDEIVAAGVYVFDRDAETEIVEMFLIGSLDCPAVHDGMTVLLESGVCDVPMPTCF